MFILEILIMPLLLSSQVLAQLPAEGGNSLGPAEGVDSLGPAEGAGVGQLPTDDPLDDEEFEDEPFYTTTVATKTTTKTVTGYPRATGTAADSHANIVETSYLSGLVLLTGLFWL
jgi:hypothetical protein